MGMRVLFQRKHMTTIVLIIALLVTMRVGAQTSVAYRIYTAQEGERPVDIAHRFNVPVDDLLRANPNLIADQPLHQGEVILVPIREAGKQATKPQLKSARLQGTAATKAAKTASAQSSTSRSSIPDPQSPSPTSVARAYWIYTVRQGDTLSTIAQRFNTTVTALARANELSPNARLSPGQVLIVPVLEQRMETPPRSSAGSSQPSKERQNVALRRPPVLPAPRVFGYVGTVVAPVAKIRSAPRSNAPVWSEVVRGTQLIVTAERTGWFGVLMINGATGWMPRSALRKENRAIFWDDLVRAFGGVTGRDNSAVVAEAMRYLGVPYRYGGTSPVKGLDCSAFVQRVFASRGIRLPRTAAEQARVGLPVPISQLQPGDRLYFAVKGNRIDHCGIYIGNGLFIHASGRHNAVVISSLSEPLYARSLVAIRR